MEGKGVGCLRRYLAQDDREAFPQFGQPIIRSVYKAMLIEGLVQRPVDDNGSGYCLSAETKDNRLGNGDLKGKVKALGGAIGYPLPAG